MKVLVIYEMVPEETLFFSVEDPSVELLNVLHKANGNYVNIDTVDGEGEKAALIINNECISDDYLPEGYERQFPGEFQNIEINDLPNHGPFGMVFHTGFYI